MKIAILTNEYPPHVYGGAGVHVEYLTRELAALVQDRHAVDVLCFGDQRESRGNLRIEGVQAPLQVPVHDQRHARLLATLLQDLVMSGKLAAIDIVHCHTWYTHLAGCLVKYLQAVPLVLTTHSLEPHRPWKAEQLGTAYDVSTWIERTAYQSADGVIAVSASMKRDVHELYGVPIDRIEVIHNGIDPEQYRPTNDPALLDELHIRRDLPYVLFVGRITRQKGIIHLVNAVRHLQPGVQVVLCAGAPDTPEILQEMTDVVRRARIDGGHDIIWIRDMLPRHKLIPLFSQAAIFVCPSVYEPFGIINLEAMACETPVVAAAVGGILEVVADGQTGLLVPFEPVGPADVEPRRPEQFSRELAAAVNMLLANAALGAEMGRKSRRRVVEQFSWASIARQTLDFYQQVMTAHRGATPGPRAST
ncbi:MAG: glycogen synthase [Luteitalea sp.]|nr:glycogen synthase [Luteitalea sp.]